MSETCPTCNDGDFRKLLRNQRLAWEQASCDRLKVACENNRGVRLSADEVKALQSRIDGLTATAANQEAVLMACDSLQRNNEDLIELLDQSKVRIEKLERALNEAARMHVNTFFGDNLEIHKREDRAYVTRWLNQAELEYASEQEKTNKNVLGLVDCKEKR